MTSWPCHHEVIYLAMICYCCVTYWVYPWDLRISFHFLNHVSAFLSFLLSRLSRSLIWMHPCVAFDRKNRETYIVARVGGKLNQYGWWWWTDGRSKWVKKCGFVVSSRTPAMLQCYYVIAGASFYVTVCLLRS